MQSRSSPYDSTARRVMLMTGEYIIAFSCRVRNELRVKTIALKKTIIDIIMQLWCRSERISVFISTERIFSKTL